MSIKAPAYWPVHKEVYQDLLDELDEEVRDIVLKDSNSLESVNFNKKVNEEVERRIEHRYGEEKTP
jgi:hypothetical protein